MTQNTDHQETNTQREDITMHNTTDTTPEATGHAQNAEQGVDEQTPATEADDQQDAAQDTEQSDEIGKVRKEAAAHRRKLRESETETQNIADQLTSMRREKLATHMEQNKSFRPELLELIGHDPSEFFSADGTLDEKTLTETIKTVSEQYGIHTGATVKYVNLGDTGPSNTPDWTTALKGGYTR